MTLYTCCYLSFFRAGPVHLPRAGRVGRGRQGGQQRGRRAEEQEPGEEVGESVPQGGHQVQGLFSLILIFHEDQHPCH